ncbi:MAG TPA: hypothetical protein VGX25_09325 [Actinophytocola sp.]|uniref:hypothetical protein n=1 Tax=Actinophytocola sp. TaxID=1872138 RepID=UPI002DDCE79C|nr:hypothetical protein [Actinophytocola sp.]HEV2779588.1 hypothetical protein [Actinophytocola sp.]
MAAKAVAGGEGDREDATGLPLVTIDPPGSKDLDQAVLVETRAGGGFRVHHAIGTISRHPSMPSEGAHQDTPPRGFPAPPIQQQTNWT